MKNITVGALKSLLFYIVLFGLTLNLAIYLFGEQHPLRKLIRVAEVAIPFLVTIFVAEWKFKVPFARKIIPAVIGLFWIGIFIFVYFYGLDTITNSFIGEIFPSLDTKDAINGAIVSCIFAIYSFFKWD